LLPRCPQRDNGKNEGTYRCGNTPFAQILKVIVTGAMQNVFGNEVEFVVALSSSLRLVFE
jgi:hypothetical protein